MGDIDMSLQKPMHGSAWQSPEKEQPKVPVEADVGISPERVAPPGQLDDSDLDSAEKGLGLPDLPSLPEFPTLEQHPLRKVAEEVSIPILPEFPPGFDSSEGQLQPPPQIPELRYKKQVCGCGNVFMRDAVFCRRCGKKRIEARDEACSCGNILLPDANFCRKCGKQRDEATHAGYPPNGLPELPALPALPPPQQQGSMGAASLAVPGFHRTAPPTPGAMGTWVLRHDLTTPSDSKHIMQEDTATPSPIKSPKSKTRFGVPNAAEALPQALDSLLKVPSPSFPSRRQLELESEGSSTQRSQGSTWDSFNPASLPAGHGHMLNDPFSGSMTNLSQVSDARTTGAQYWIGTPPHGIGEQRMLVSDMYATNHPLNNNLNNGAQWPPAPAHPSWQPSESAAVSMQTVCSWTEAQWHEGTADSGIIGALDDSIGNQQIFTAPPEDWWDDETYELALVKGDSQPLQDGVLQAGGFVAHGGFMLPDKALGGFMLPDNYMPSIGEQFVNPDGPFESSAGLMSSGGLDGASSAPLSPVGHMLVGDLHEALANAAFGVSDSGFGSGRFIAPVAKGPTGHLPPNPWGNFPQSSYAAHGSNNHVQIAPLQQQALFPQESWDSHGAIEQVQASFGSSRRRPQPSPLTDLNAIDELRNVSQQVDAHQSPMVPETPFWNPTGNTPNAADTPLYAISVGADTPADGLSPETHVGNPDDEHIHLGLDAWGDFLDDYWDDDAPHNS